MPCPTFDDLLAAEAEDEGRVAGEARVNEGPVLEMESILLVDGVSDGALAALVVLDLVRHLKHISIRIDLYKRRHV